MEIHEIENNAVRYVSEANVVILDSFSSVDHSNIVELWFSHRFKDWDLLLDSLKVSLGSFIGIHTMELHHISYIRKTERVPIFTSGEDILTLRAFSSRIFWSSTYDSRNRVYLVLALQIR